MTEGLEIKPEYRHKADRIVHLLGIANEINSRWNAFFTDPWLTPTNAASTARRDNRRWYKKNKKNT